MLTTSVTRALYSLFFSVLAKGFIWGISTKIVSFKDMPSVRTLYIGCY